MPLDSFEYDEHLDLDDEGCPGHPCEDAAEQFPHAGIGDVFYCDGSCVR